MLHSAKALQGFAVLATDGDIGTITDVYFDDARWTIRYLVVETGGWLSGRRVLISPMSFRTPDWDKEEIHVDLSRRQVEESPGIDTEKPISRQQEEEFYRHYDYPLYWVGPLLWGFGAFPPIGGMFSRDRDAGTSSGEGMDAAHVDSHLRSTADVIGYHIRATDDTVGHVDDFLFDEKDWSIQFMIVDTRNWLPGKHVLISPQRIDSVSWPDRHVFVNVTRRAIEASPEYDADHPPTPEERNDLYRGSRD
jgi:uncharacterized protein YrrD